MFVNFFFLCFLNVMYVYSALTAEASRTFWQGASPPATKITSKSCLLATKFPRICIQFRLWTFLPLKKREFSFLRRKNKREWWKMKMKLSSRERSRLLLPQVMLLAHRRSWRRLGYVEPFQRSVSLHEMKNSGPWQNRWNEFHWASGSEGGGKRWRRE